MQDPPADTASPDASPLSPTVARRRLGGDLRRFREQARLTLVEVGRELQRSQATMSRLEKGESPLRAVDVEKMLDIYRDAGVGEAETARPDLLRLLDTGREKEWFSPFRDVLAGDMTDEHVENLISYETNAERIRAFEPEIVLGLLQAPAYASAVIAAYFPDHAPARRERLVALRMERGERLRRLRRPRLDVVLGENALYRDFEAPDAMAEQLRSIANEVRDGTPTISVRIVPATLGLPAAIGGPFTVIDASDPVDPDVVYLETRAGASYRSDPEDVASYGTRFDTLVDAAYPEQETLDRIEEAIKQFT